jgi:hypothetical protein
MSNPAMQNQLGFCLAPKGGTISAWRVAPGYWIAHKQALKARFSPHLVPDLAVSRAFSAGHFRIPTILGRCPGLDERSAVGALKNFRAALQSFTNFTQTQK